MLEDNGYDIYTVKVDGSGRVIHRNRKYLRAFTPENSHLLRGPSEQTRNNEGPDYIQVDKTPVDVHTQSTKQPSPMNERDSPVAP